MLKITSHRSEICQSHCLKMSSEYYSIMFINICITYTWWDIYLFNTYYLLVLHVQFLKAITFLFKYKCNHPLSYEHRSVCLYRKLFVFIGTVVRFIYMYYKGLQRMIAFQQSLKFRVYCWTFIYTQGHAFFSNKHYSEYKERKASFIEEHRARAPVRPTQTCHGSKEEGHEWSTAVHPPN